MTPEERLSWLRERGVQIVTPGERKVAKVASAIRQADAAGWEVASDVDARDEELISLVCIPADPTEPLQEVAYSQPTSAPGTDPTSFVLEFLRPRFRTLGVGVDLSRLDPSAKTLLASGGIGGDGDADDPEAGRSLPSVSDATLLDVAQDDVHIETFTLVHPSTGESSGSNDSNGQIPSLVYYLDEIGSLKHLPVNRRASSYAERAGYSPPPTFYGDVYAGRISPGTRRSLSCRISDLDRVDQYLLSNLNYQMQQNRLTGRPERSQQPEIAGTGESAQAENGFSWRQSESDLEISVPLPSSNDTLLTSKQVKVTFRPQALSVAALGMSVLDVRLFERVDVDSSTWTLENSGSGSGPAEARQQVVVVSVEKAEEALWPRILD